MRCPRARRDGGPPEREPAYRTVLGRAPGGRRHQQAGGAHKNTRRNKSSAARVSPLEAGLLLSTPIQVGEETGWRGYALPRLAERMGLAWGSVLLGVIWAVWHLPLFFMPVTDVFGQSLPTYVIQVTALSVAMGWLYAHTNGSLLLIMLMHASINNTKDVVPSLVQGAANPWALSTSPVSWLTAGLLWLCVGFFLVRMPRLEAVARVRALTVQNGDRASHKRSHETTDTATHGH